MNIRTIIKMLNRLLLLLTLFILLLNSCKKVTDIHIPNCDNLIIDTTITANSSPFVYYTLHIPSIFTPNGDGEHDTWYIQNLEYYPFQTVTIYNSVAQVIYQVNGNYLEYPWDGTHNGQPLPEGKYYYKIQFTTPGGHHLACCGDLYVYRTCIPDNINSASLYYGGDPYSSFDQLDPTRRCH